MQNNDTNKAFADITTQFSRAASPYEARPVQQGSKKTVTPKGKVALVAVSLVATGLGITAWQTSQADQSDNGLRTEQVALERKRTEIELAKAQTEIEKTRTKNYTACVEQGKDKVGDFGQSRMDDLIEKCNAVFPSVIERNTNSAGSPSQGDFDGWWVIGGGAVVGLWLGARKIARAVGDNA